MHGDPFEGPTQRFDGDQGPFDRLSDQEGRSEGQTRKGEENRTGGTEGPSAELTQ